MTATVHDPATIERLIERSADLEAALLDAAERPRYADELDDAFDDRLGDRSPKDEGDVANAYDYFFFQHRLADGRTFVEHFVERHPELPADEREMLLGWRDVVEGIFAVTRREGDQLILDNLVDELTYPTRSNRGAEALDQVPVGSFIVARVVPVGDRWLLSGSLQIFPRSSRLHIYRTAAELALRVPRLAFRNPDKLAEARRLQREDRAAFVALFGSDTVVVPGRELPALLRRFRRFQAFDWRGEDGKTVAERVEAETGRPPDPADVEHDLDLGETMLAAETVGVIYDESDGMNFFLDYGLVADAFAQPDLLADPDYEAVVAEYLEEPDIIPLPLRRLAEQHPTHVNQVFRNLLGVGDFSWRRDGEALLQTYKPDSYAREPVPAVAPLGETLAAALREEPTPARKVGRNDPCPCGSGKKFKRCCGAA